MAMSDVYVLAGSAAVIAFMVAVAALLGFRDRARIGDEAQARRLVGEFDPDLEIRDVVVAADGRAALARLAGEKLAVLRAIGDSVSVRSFAAGSVALTRRGETLRARFGDLGFPTLNMKLNAWPGWLEALTRTKTS